MEKLIEYTSFHIISHTSINICIVILDLENHFQLILYKKITIV